MKITLPLVALIATASAQYYNISSKPFQLVVESADGSLKDTLSTCHTGAALESLCLSNGVSTSKTAPIAPASFNFNTSLYMQAPVNHTDLGVPGILTWDLPVSSLGPIPSSVFFNYDPSTNIAVPILRPGDTNPQILAFNDKDELIVQGYVDWTANPPTYGETYGLKRWFACQTYYASYQYENLAWGLGAGKPENPTCVAVNVKRVFI